jgi:hypothetical protein
MPLFVQYRDKAEHELSSFPRKDSTRYEELVSIKERPCKVITLIIFLRYSVQFSPNSQLRSKALALFDKLKEHGMHNEVWSSTPKTLHHEYHDHRNQQSVSRTIPPVIKILCSVT